MLCIGEKCNEKKQRRLREKLRLRKNSSWGTPCCNYLNYNSYLFRFGYNFK